MIKNNINNIQIDYVAKYENINEEIINILKKIGISKYTKHLHLIDEQYKTNSTQKNKITKYFTEDSLETINILFHEDFEHFGYTKFHSLDELNNYLEQIKEKEENINTNLLHFYNYQSKNVTDENIINELFIHEILNEM
jgi:L-rhamnose mutarotase